MNATCTIRKKSNLLYNQRLCRRNPAYQMAWNQQNHHNRGKCGQIDYNYRFPLQTNRDMIYEIVFRIQRDKLEFPFQETECQCNDISCQKTF